MTARDKAMSIRESYEKKNAQKTQGEEKEAPIEHSKCSHRKCWQSCMKRKDVPCPSLQVCTLQPDQYMKKVPEEEFHPPVDEYSRHTCI